MRRRVFRDGEWIDTPAVLNPYADDVRFAASEGDTSEFDDGDCFARRGDHGGYEVGEVLENGVYFVRGAGTSWEDARADAKHTRRLELIEEFFGERVLDEAEAETIGA